MNTKILLKVALLGFVAVSVIVALRKISPDSSSHPEPSVASADAATVNASVGLDADLAGSQFSAVYFHAPHRCPTCRKIESYAHEALTPEIDAGKINWQVADYTSDANSPLVEQFKVFTSTVVLVETRDGKVVRWRNLEEVWNHTGQQADFTAFISQAWSEFKAS